MSVANSPPEEQPKNLEGIRSVGSHLWLGRRGVEFTALNGLATGALQNVGSDGAPPLQVFWALWRFAERSHARRAIQIWEGTRSVGSHLWLGGRGLEFTALNGLATVALLNLGSDGAPPLQVFGRFRASRRGSHARRAIQIWRESAPSVPIFWLSGLGLELTGLNELATVALLNMGSDGAPPLQVFGTFALREAVASPQGSPNLEGIRSVGSHLWLVDGEWNLPC